MKRKAIIIDIDGTLGVDKIQTPIPVDGTREDWDNFHKQHEYYIPENFKEFKYIIDIVNNWYYHDKDNTMFIFMTARENCDLVFLNTLRLIRKLFPFFTPQKYGKDYMLVMRFFNDFREDWKIKKDLMQTEILPCCTPVMAIDDKEENIQMFKELDVPMVLQVYGG